MKVEVQLFATLIFIIGSSALAQSKLPPCYSMEHKHNCQGEGQLSEDGRYRGEYRFNKPNGFGEVSFQDGSRYVGSFSDGNFQGYGTYYYSNKDRYVGEWLNDKMQGSGTYFFSNGSKFVGTFREGRISGIGTEYDADGQALRSGWWHGRQVFTNRQAMIQSFAECIAATSIAQAQGSMSGLADVTLSMGRILNQLNERYTSMANTKSELDSMNRLSAGALEKYAVMGPRQGIDFAFQIIKINRCASLIG